MSSTLRCCGDDVAVAASGFCRTDRILMKRVTVFLFSTLIASAAAAQTPAPAGCAGARDVRLVNGRIATMDAKNAIASEVTIQNGVITSVGRNGARLSPCTRVVDLKG